MRLIDIPTPAAVLARPRDERGYPVPAITPWEEGVPRFAATGVARTFLCAVERRCSICGTPMEPGPVWRVVAGPEAEAIADARSRGISYTNLSPTAEAPGHRTCMLYAAVVCPYLARPNARRGVTAQGVGFDAVRGTARGEGGAVVSFDEYEYGYLDATVLFRFIGLGEFRPHMLGDEQELELATAVAAEAGEAPVPPPYLLTDEAAADARFQAYLQGQIISPTDAE